MSEDKTKRMSRHFTVVVRRQLNLPAEKVFGAWVDPNIRHRVLSHGRYKNGIKEINIVEGGSEHYEDRWKNRLYDKTSRRYVIIRPSKQIVAQVETSVEGDMFDQHFATQELLLFKPNEHGVEIVASSQCISIEPYYTHSIEDAWSDMFNTFEQVMSTYSPSS